MESETDYINFEALYRANGLSEKQIAHRLALDAKRRDRQQRESALKPKFKFTPSMPPADSPQIQKLNESMALMETDPTKRYKMACRLLTYYENLCTEYNTAGYGTGQRTNVRERRDFWQSEIDRLLIEII